MAKRKSPDTGKTEFERFFHNGEWERLLDTTMIPKSARTFPPAGPESPEDFSWDRRAAWLVFSQSSARKRRRHTPFPWDAPQ